MSPSAVPKTPADAASAADSADDAKSALNAAVRSVRSYDAVVVLGAGASAASFPMTAELPALLWDAFRDNEAATNILRQQTGLPGSPKDILGVGPDQMAPGWSLMRELPDLRSSFQLAFAALDTDRDPMPVHYALARLIAEDRVALVISFNWDTCLERAYEELHGISIPPNKLLKPHGDASDPEAAWVLPDEDGLVPRQLLDRVDELRDRPRTLLIIGYSVSDATVAKTLVDPLRSTWPTYTVSPSASGANALTGSADSVMSALADAVLGSTSINAWRIVRFNRSRGLDAALRGERLRPVDVDACPEFPNAPRLAERLMSTSFATISGDSGSGKSITAFHAARRLNEAGWKIVEPHTIGVLTVDDVTEFTRLPGPILAIVDDAQALPREVVASLREAVDGDHGVLLVSTERLESRGDEVLSAKRATRLLHEWCVRNLESVAPRIISLDDRVAWSSFHETPNERLATAARSSPTPWVYMFAASGGERRLGGELDRLVDGDDEGRTATLLGVICARQFVSEDSGADRMTLARDLSEATGRETGANELTEMLGPLISDRLIVENGDRFRAAHIRLASHALRDLALRDEDAIGNMIRAHIARLFRDPAFSVTGKWWLFQTFERYDAFRHREQIRTSFLPDETIVQLVDECLAARSGPERGVALYLLWSLDFFLDGLERPVMERIADRIVEWMPEIDSDEAYGFHWMIGRLRSRQTDLYRKVVDSTDPSTLAQRLSLHGTRGSADSWARLLSEFAPGPEADAETWASWRERFGAGIDGDALHGWITNTDDEIPGTHLFGLIDTLAGLSTTTAIGVVEACAAQVRHEIEEDLLHALPAFSDWTFGLLFIVAMKADALGANQADDPDEDADLNPDRDLQDGGEEAEAVPTEWATLDEAQLDSLAQRVLALFRQVDWSRAATSLTNARRYELESLDLMLAWLAALSTDLLDNLTTAIPDEWLLSLAVKDGSGEKSSTPDVASISPWLRLIAQGPKGFTRVQALLDAMRDDLAEFPHDLIEQFPAVATHVSSRGGRVLLHAPRASGWKNATAELSALIAEDPDTARRAFTDSSERLLHGLTEPQQHDLKAIDLFIAAADELDPALFDALISEVDVERAVQAWEARCADSPDLIRVVLKRASTATGDAADLAARLTRTTLANGSAIN